MAEVLLFHHAQGLTSGVRALADELRADGHVVHVPDLFDGRTFDSLAEGLGHVEEQGLGPLRDRGVAEADPLPRELVYVGLSLGVLPAQQLAQTRAGARGAVLCHACLPPAQLGSAWPPDVAVQVHGMEQDPVFAGEGDLVAARELTDSAEQAELFLYPGDRHLFTDRSLEAYDADAAALVTRRVLDLLARVG